MKKILLTLFLSFFFIGSVSAQDNFKREISYSLEKSNFNYDIEIVEEGLYEVFIVGTNGERIAQPLENTKLKSGTETIQFNTKFWPAGQYRLVINKDGMPFRSEKFSINPKR